jgi:membrane-bound ClpP family serine protease
MSDAAPPSLEVDRWLIAAVVVILVAPSVWVGRSVAKLKERKPTEGLAAMIGLVGVARTTLNPAGTVYVRNELWQATAPDGESIPAGHAVVVKAAHGLTLQVAKSEQPAPQPDATPAAT